MESARSPHPAVRPILSRRAVLKGAGLALGLALAGCGGAPATAKPPDNAARFARYAAADEPNGNLAAVVWPDFVLNAGPEVRQLYAFQVEHGDLMRYMPCFCGCDLSSGHRNNRDCYIKAVNADGSVVFDSMAPT